MIASRVIDELLNRLVNRGALQAVQLAELEERGVKAQEELEKILKNDYGVKPEEILLCLADYARIPVLTLGGYEPEEASLKLVPPKFMRENNVFPVSATESTLTLALSDPLNIMVIQKVADLTHLQVLPVAVLESDLSDAISRADSSSGSQMQDILQTVGDANIEFSSGDEHVDIAEALEGEGEMPVIKVVNMILMEALRKKASDIHIEPFEKMVALRFRIDGALHTGAAPPKSMQFAISSRIKVMSQLDIAERRIPQDGKFRIKAMGKDIDLRVSTLPTVHGEKICMRILDKGNLKAGLDDLGLDPDALKKLKLAVANPHGLILVTGPTGSGKTTTLYSCLQELNKPDVNIVTVENPVEYQVDGINQVEINEKTGMTFSAALRSILRQDPDIVLVGETRDEETANIAVKAALTGHLVMTTLHTNSAPGAITRLGDMGIAPFLLSSSIVLAQAQRLVKTICPNCKGPLETLDAEFCELNQIPVEMFEGKELFEGKGCSKCGNTGYKGRASIMEIVMMTPKLKHLVLHGANGDEIAEAAVDDQGFADLKMAGYRRVLEGVTTLQEVMRVAAGDH